MVWQSIERYEMNSVLCATLFSARKSVDKLQLKARGDEFLQECHAQQVECIAAVGTQALKAISHVTGKSTKLVGATITGGAVPYVIPVDTHWGGYRAFRSYAWTQAMGRFIKRGRALAQGEGRRLFQFGPIVTGETIDAENALERIYEAKLPVGNDIETTGKDWRTDKLTAMGLANADVAVSVPWDQYTSRKYGPQPGLRSDKIRHLVLAILADTRITKIFHNGMFDLSVLGRQGIAVNGPIEDTLLAHKICYPDLFHNLQFCMSYEFALHPWKTAFDLERKRRKEGDQWADTDPQPLMLYNAQDAAAELPLWKRLIAKLNVTHRGWENYAKLKELARFAAGMQYNGVRIDLAARNVVAGQVQARIATVEAEWQALAPGVPIAGEGSGKQVAHYFFKTLGAPVLARSKRTERAQLNGAVLLEYAGMKDITPKLAHAAWTLFTHRKITKTLNAFLTPLNEARVHAKPNPTGTRGSRFSYSDPNLQQWSKEKTIHSPYTNAEVVLAPNLRHLVCADDGMLLGESDYNALEVRIVAYAANILVWLDWLARGVDMHSEHVWQMFGRRVAKDDPLRQITKVLTFARFYNRKKTVDQVLRALKPSMPSLTAALLVEIFDRFDVARPEVPQWQDEREAFVRKYGYIELPLSGVRQYHDRKMPDLNAAFSFGIQSTGGDIINPAAVRIVARLDAEAGERVLLNVHDALLWQARPERAKAVEAIVREEMERPVSLWGHNNVVFPVESKVGHNWRDLKGLKA